MNHTFSTDIRRAIFSKGFYIAVIGMMIAIIIGAFDKILPIFQEGIAGGLANGFHIEILISSLSSGTMLLCVPIICALPYTASVLDDIKSGYIKSYILRSDRKRYTVAKAVAAALSGGLALFIGIMFCYLIFALIFSPMELAIIPTEIQTDIGMMTETIAQPSMFMKVLGKGLMFFLCGSLWSLVGLALATGTQSRYMAYASPFILYYVLIILAERYFKDFVLLNPKEWLIPTQEWPGGNWGISLLIIELIILVSIAFALLCKRRLSNE